MIIHIKWKPGKCPNPEGNATRIDTNGIPATILIEESYNNKILWGKLIIGTTSQYLLLKDIEKLEIL